jgi:hypothetical protein
MKYSKNNLLRVEVKFHIRVCEVPGSNLGGVNHLSRLRIFISSRRMLIHTVFFEIFTLSPFTITFPFHTSTY